MEEQSAEERRLDAIGRSLPSQHCGMKTFDNRLKTFMHWPKSDIVSPKSLAKAGFFYTHTSDWVKCAFCHQGIINWVHGDTALGEHKKWNPFCEYVRKLENEDQPEENTVDIKYPCVVCWNAEINHLFLPCRHVVCCQRCTEIVTTCAVCRTHIDSVLKVFLP